MEDWSGCHTSQKIMCSSMRDETVYYSQLQERQQKRLNNFWDINDALQKSLTSGINWLTNCSCSAVGRPYWLYYCVNLHSCFHGNTPKSFYVCFLLEVKSAVFSLVEWLSCSNKLHNVYDLYWLLLLEFYWLLVNDREDKVCESSFITCVGSWLRYQGKKLHFLPENLTFSLVANTSIRGLMKKLCNNLLLFLFLWDLWLSTDYQIYHISLSIYFQ